MSKNNKNVLLILVILLVIFGLVTYFGYQNTKQKNGALIIVSSSTNTKSDTHTIDDLRLTYQLRSATQKLYDIKVMSAVQFAAENGTTVSGNDGDVFVTGKACNGMSGTIPILAKGTITDKQSLNVLNDGRIVLPPQIMSTLMACPAGNPATDDQALNEAINDVASSLQSF